MIKLHILVFILVPFCTFSQDLKCLKLADWDTVDLPSDNYFRELNSSNDDWEVELMDGQPLFCLNRDLEYSGDTLDFDLESIDREIFRDNRISLMGHHHYLKVSNGWLIGTNKGEWGGNLFWIGNDHKNFKKLGKANVNQILYWNNEIIVLEGLSHGSLRGGHVLRISSAMEIDTLMIMEETPHCAAISNDSTIYIMTDNILYSVDHKYNKTSLYQNDNWTYLYQSKIVFYANRVYISMRGGVGVYDTENHDMKWMSRR